MGDTLPSGQPFREASDALAGEVSNGSAARVRDRSSARALHDDRALSPTRGQSEDRLQAARALRGRRRARARRAKPHAAPMSAPDRRRAGCTARRRTTGASELGAGEARAVSRTAASARARVARDQHRRRSLEAARSRAPSPAPPPHCASGHRADHDERAERSVDGRLQGPVQDARRRLLLPRSRSSISTRATCSACTAY
jgi:hypothetical protein